MVLFTNPEYQLTMHGLKCKLSLCFIETYQCLSNRCVATMFGRKVANKRTLSQNRPHYMMGEKKSLVQASES